MSRHAGHRPAHRARAFTGMGADRQRRPCRAGRQTSRSLRRLCRLFAHECARGGGQGGRARVGGRRQREPADTNVDGAPIDQEQFLPIYEIIEKSGKPILLHPIRTREMADYRTETVSKYEICSVIGWPFETGAALARLVFSGIMDRFPNLKVISHHLGGIIPYFDGRVAYSWDQLGVRTSDEDYSLILKRLKKRPFDYFKGFYGDTALAGARAPTICGISFFGPDHVLFASDCPFDKEKGRGYIRSTIAVLESLDLPQADMEKICYKNAQSMFGLRKSRAKHH